MSDVNQSHLEKLEYLPEGWADSSVSEIVHMISASNKKLAQKNYLEEGEFPVIDQGQDFIGGYSNDKSLVIEEEPPFIVFGDHTRAFKFANFQFVPGADGIKIMKPLGVNPKWCFYIFQAIKLPNKGYARHFQYLKEAYVPVPPAEQQIRIVAKIEELFSHIDAGIDALKKTKQLLKQYRQSVLKAAVTGELTKEWREANGVSFDESWKTIELADVVDIIDPNPSHRYPPYDDGDVPLMATKQMVGEDDWDESTAKLTTSEFYEQRKTSHGFEYDDIIFARKGRLGLARRPPKIKRYAFSHTVFILRCSDGICSEYLLWCLRREDAISWLLREMNAAAGVPTLGKAILGKLPLLLPSKEEQKTIVEEIEDKLSIIRRTTENIDLQMEKAERSKQSILAEMYSNGVN